MANIALISCVSQKCGHRASARNMYTSVLFKKTLKYTETILRPDKIYVLSAKYYLWPLDGEEKDDYNETLIGKNKQDKDDWAEKVLRQLNEENEITNDRFYILAGKNYYENLLSALKNYEIPMEGLTIGKRYQWLNTQLSKGNN